LRERNRKAKNNLISFALSVIASIVFVMAGTASSDDAFASLQQSDLDWAVSKGFVAPGVKPEQEITQADFLRMVMTQYQSEKQGVVVPPGAENHWAAPYYATAKQEGLIDCSCQIKPERGITLVEAAKIVMLGINRKANKPLLSMSEVQNWVAGKEAKSTVTYQDASVLLRKMSEVYEHNKLARS
jgi:hypothetical protein